MQKTRILDRGCPDNDVADAIIQATFDGIEIADSTAELNRDFIAERLDDFLDRAFIFWFACKSAVQIDKMQPFAA